MLSEAKHRTREDTNGNLSYEMLQHDETKATPHRHVERSETSHTQRKPTKIFLM